MQHFSFLFLIITVLLFGIAEFEQITPTETSMSDTNYEDNTTQSRILLDKVIGNAFPCECLENKCSCRFNFFDEDPSNLHSGELSVEYDVVNGLLMSLQVGDSENHATIKDIISGVELPALCVRVPHLRAMKFCAVVYDLRLNQDFGLHLCLSVESQALMTTISSISFDCVNLSKNNVNTVAPDQHRPSLVELHVGKSPKVTFFNSVSLGVLPPIINPVIEDAVEQS